MPIALGEPFAAAREAAGVRHELISLPGMGLTPVMTLPGYMPAMLRLLEEARP